VHWLMVSGNGSVDIFEAAHSLCGFFLAAFVTMDLIFQRAHGPLVRILVSTIVSCAGSAIFALSTVWQPLDDEETSMLNAIIWCWIRPEAVAISAWVISSLSTAALRITSLQPYFHMWSRRPSNEFFMTHRRRSSHRTNAPHKSALYPTDSSAYSRASLPPPPYSSVGEVSV
jgi:hypothetical protein